MRTAILVAAAAVLGLWSLFAWAVYGLLGFAGGLAAANADFLPIAPELIVWTVELLGGMGGLAVWVLWGLGAAIIAILTAVLLGLLGGGRNERLSARQGAPVAYGGDMGAAPPRHRSGDEIVARVLGRETPPRDRSG